MLYVRLARPHQYVKNGFIWLPAFFAHKLWDVSIFWPTFWAFICFCLAASSVYVLNDLQDLEEDREHPVKKNRPLASGALTSKGAITFLVLLLTFTILLAWTFLNINFFLVLIAYILLNIGYSISLKHVAIVDIVCIALGFELRIFAGGLAANIAISHWIVIMTFLLAIFLALAKRRDDLLLCADGHQTRKCIDGYSMEFVHVGMAIMAAVIIIAYIMYTVSPDTIQKHGTDKLYLTAFWVLLGLLRYLQDTYVKGQSGSPTQIVLNDRFLQATMALWIINIYIILYLVKYNVWLERLKAYLLGSQ